MANNEPNEEVEIVDVDALTDTDEIEGMLGEAYGEYLDINHEIIMAARKQAGALQQLYNLHVEAAEKVEFIGALVVKQAQLCASAIGDAIVSEWLVGDDDLPGDSDSDEEVV